VRHAASICNQKITCHPNQNCHPSEPETKPRKLMHGLLRQPIYLKEEVNAKISVKTVGHQYYGNYVTLRGSRMEDKVPLSLLLKNIVKYERNTIVLMKKAYSNRKSQWKHS
jgi:hypothetical protein